MTFKEGDRVYVTDPALAELRTIMRDATGEDPPPNHHGTVAEVAGDAVVINFDDGVCAIYPTNEVRASGEG